MPVDDVFELNSCCEWMSEKAGERFSGRAGERQTERAHTVYSICVFACFVGSVLVVVVALLVAACKFAAQFCEINAKRAFYRMYLHVHTYVTCVCLCAA